MSHRLVQVAGVTFPRGFRAAGVAAGLKVSRRPDIAVLFSERPATAAGAFTANRFAAAPVEYDRAVLERGGAVRAVVINSGNANACTGLGGLADAEATARHAAALLGVEPEEVLVASTGRIGVRLPMDRLLAGVETACGALSPDGGRAAAEAIMTTDTRPKEAGAKIDLVTATLRIGGMVKGAGMIAPTMKPAGLHATMLAFVTTDAAVSADFLRRCTAEAVERSFNRITVDGDMSTNDTVLVLANGASNGPTLTAENAGAAEFANALTAVMQSLARQIVLDGEGATKFVEVCVRGAVDDGQARACADAIANSVLCKTAWFGGDPNWGRVLAAAGYSGAEFAPERVNLDYNGTPIVRNGVDAGTPEEAQARAMAGSDLCIELDLGAGSGSAVVWTCDLSYDYVKINAEYHT